MDRENGSLSHLYSGMALSRSSSGMMLQALYAGDFRPGEMKLEHPGCARAGREIQQLRAELEQKLPGEDFALVEKLLDQTLLARDAECADCFSYGFSAGLLLAREARELVERQMKGK